MWIVLLGYRAFDFTSSAYILIYFYAYIHIVSKDTEFTTFHFKI